MNQHSILILHGLGGSGPDHWQTWLSKELSQRNYHVCYPTFSSYDSPDKEVWLKELSSAMETIPENNTLTVITHSLGCLLWLHYSEGQNFRKANNAILVAPPSPAKVISEAQTFYPVPLNGYHLTSISEETLFIHSTDDPYCSIDDITKFLKLGVPSISLPNMGHINTNSGYGKWPWILKLCMNISMFLYK